MTCQFHRRTVKINEMKAMTMKKKKSERGESKSWLKTQHSKN